LPAIPQQHQLHIPPPLPFVQLSRPTTERFTTITNNTNLQTVPFPPVSSPTNLPSRVSFPIAPGLPVQPISPHIGEMYPSYKNCYSLEDMLQTHSPIPFSEDICAASTAAALQIASGKGIDFSLLNTHTTSASSLGILHLITTLGDANAHRTLQSLPGDSELISELISGGKIILHSNFIANSGHNVKVYPESIAPPGVLECHYADLTREGRGLILPLAFVQSMCISEKLTLNVSNGFITPKGNKPLGRLVSDYTGDRSNINHPDKKDLLARKYGKIVYPQFPQINQQFLSAFTAFPNKDIYGTRVDINAAHNRIRIWPAHVLLCAMLFTKNDVAYLFLPLENQFGSQDTVSQWDVIANDIQSRSTARNLSHHFVSDLSSAYVDDFSGAYDYTSADIEITALSRDALLRCGTDPVSNDKTIKELSATILGYLWNTVSRTVTVSENIFRKVLRLIFVDIAGTPSVGDSIQLDQLQRLASYAMRLANCLTPLLPFSRGFSAATSRIPFYAKTARWTERAITDLHAWRAVFLLSITNNRWLQVPMDTIGRLCYSHFDLLITDYSSREYNRSLRHSRNASLVGYGDACTTNNGIGIYIPNTLWCGLMFTELTSVSLTSGERRPVDINVLEFIAALITAIALIQTLDTLPTTTPRHIHIWSDNTSCLSWMKRHKADHPNHSFLLYCYSFLQVSHNLLITQGHILGHLNIYADASSRNFHCPNGEDIRSFLHHLPHWTPPPGFMNGIIQAFNLPSPSTSQMIAAALMALEYVPSSITVLPIPSSQTFQLLESRRGIMPSISHFSSTAVEAVHPQRLASISPMLLNTLCTKNLSTTDQNSGLPDSVLCLQHTPEQTQLQTPFASANGSPASSLLSVKSSSSSIDYSHSIPTPTSLSRQPLLRATVSPFVPKNISPFLERKFSCPTKLIQQLVLSGGVIPSGTATTSTAVAPLNPSHTSEPSLTSTRTTLLAMEDPVL